jgi:CNT family concentrative nucleoside transporter
MLGRFTGLLGILVILAIAVAFSANRRAINLRIVATAFALQAAIAAFVLYVPAGRAAISWLSSGVGALLGYANAGIEMVFGPLATFTGGTVFAIHVLPIVIFFASLMSVLYFLGVMQLVVAGVGRALQFVIGTKPIESLNAAANIFVGQTEAPLVIKPYLPGVTGPQLFAIMTSGMASVSGTILGAYALLGIDLEYLLAASFMSAPGGLLMAKLIMPDDPDDQATPQQLISLKEARGDSENVIQAAAVGARDGLMLAANIAAMLIAFVSLIALLNGIIGGLGGLAGIEGLSVQRILGWIFAPVMWLLDVPWSEAQAAGAIFGEKVILNEFVAYVSLGNALDSFSEKTTAVVTFALCGFANLSSIAILLGGLGSLVPGRMGEMARFGLRVVLAGSLSNLMSAALAGLFIPG